MGIAARLAFAFMLSLAAAGVIQQGLMLAVGVSGSASALPLLLPVVGLITAVFALLTGRPRGETELWWIAGAMLAVMLVLGLAIYIFGRATLVPGVGGDISYLLALFFNFYLLLPSVVAPPLHVLLLRGA